MLDANVMIAYLDSGHKFHTITKRPLQAQYVDGAVFYYSQPVLLEVKEYWRRKLLTECIQTHLDLRKKLFAKFEKLFLSYETKERKELLKDSQIKALRATLENVANDKGVELWFRLCHQALNSKFAELDRFLASASFRYAPFGDEDLYPASTKAAWPQWNGAYNLMEKFGLASMDAAILNMVNGAQGVDCFLSNDGDLHFAIKKGALKATVLASTTQR